MFSYYNSQIPMSRHSSGHKNRYKSPTFSPDNAYSSYYKSSDFDPEVRLSEKIHKLKYALKGAQQHNQQLHNKVNYYKQLYNHEVFQIKDQLKKYKKKYNNLQNQYDKKLQQLEDSRQKTHSEERQAISAAKEKTHKIKELEARIIQLQTINFQLNSKLNEKTQKLKNLDAQLQNIKEDHEYELSRKITKLEKDLMGKNKQCLGLQKQIGTFKDQLKQVQRKLEKANLTIFEQAEKNKQTYDEHKQAKNGAAVFQKQIASIRQASQKQKNELKQKIRALQKSLLEHDFNLQRSSQKLNEQCQKNQKLQNQQNQLFTSYHDLQLKYEEIVSQQYEMQKDFEKDLTIIAKQMARRHISAKSPKSSTPSTNSTNFRKRQFPHLNNG